jgi:hypothetical protein
MSSSFLLSRTSLVTFALLLGCAGKQPRDQQSGDSVTTSDLRQSIRAEIGDAPCSSSSVCQTIPFGAKACGGPQQYLIYSTSATDSARLAREVARYNEAQRKRNREEGRVSDCSVVVRPQVSCVSGQCRAAPAGTR